MLPPAELPRSQAAGVRTAWYVARAHGRGSCQACRHAWRPGRLCAAATRRRAASARPRRMVRRAPCAPPLTRSEYVMTARAQLPLYVSSGLLLGAVRLLSVQAGATLGESFRVCDALRRRLLPTESAQDPWLACRAAPPSRFTHQVTELAASLEYDPGRAMRAGSNESGGEMRPVATLSHREDTAVVAATSAAAPIPAPGPEPSPPPEVAPGQALDLQLDAPSPGGAWGDLPPLSRSPSPAFSPAAVSPASPSTPGDQPCPTQGTPAQPPPTVPPSNWPLPAAAAPSPAPAPTPPAPRKRPRLCAWDTVLTHPGGAAPTLDPAHYLRPNASLWDATTMDVFCMHTSGALRPLFESTVQQQVTTLTRHFAACRARCKAQRTAERSAAQAGVSHSLPAAWPELAECPSPPPPPLSPASWDEDHLPEVGRAESASSAADASPFPWTSIRAARLLPAERSFSADSGRGFAAPAPSVLTDLSLHSRRSSRASLMSEYSSPSPRVQRSPSVSLLEPFAQGADTSATDAGFDVSLPSATPPDAHPHLHPDTHDFYVYVTRRAAPTNDKLHPPTQPEHQRPVPGRCAPGAAPRRSARILASAGPRRQRHRAPAAAISLRADPHYARLTR